MSTRVESFEDALASYGLPDGKTNPTEVYSLLPQDKILVMNQSGDFQAISWRNFTDELQRLGVRQKEGERVVHDVSGKAIDDFLNAGYKPELEGEEEPLLRNKRFTPTAMEGLAPVWKYVGRALAKGYTISKIEANRLQRQTTIEVTIDD